MATFLVILGFCCVAYALGYFTGQMFGYTRGYSIGYDQAEIDMKVRRHVS